MKGSEKRNRKPKKEANNDNEAQRRGGGCKVYEQKSPGTASYCSEGCMQEEVERRGLHTL